MSKLLRCKGREKKIGNAARNTVKYSGFFDSELNTHFHPQ
jgi:hypothetical protein